MELKVTPKPTDKLVFDLKVYQIDYNEQKKESLRKTISEKYGVPLKNVEVNLVPITVNDKGEKFSIADDIISNIQDPKFQQQLFGDYMKLKETSNINLEDIVAIDEQINSFVDFNSYSKYKTYKFKYVKWSNYLSYGEDNYFDFTKAKGFVLLNGQPENQCGKTTFAIDLLRFALFGKAQKSPTLDSVFNIYRPEATEVVVEAGIEIDSVDYVIRRTITRPPLKKRTKKSKPKQKLEYYKVINGNYELIENCEAENTAATNNIIRESVGNVDDFNLVISATAYTLGDLLRMGQTDKGKLFSRWLGLLSIEKKEEIAKEMWKKNISPKLYSNTYNKATLNEEKENLNICIKDNDKKISDKNEELIECQNKIGELNKNKMDVISRRKDIKEELIKIDITTLDAHISRQDDDLQIKRSQMRTLKEEYATIKDVTFSEEDVVSKKNEIAVAQKTQNGIQIENAEIKTKISVLKEENAKITKLIEQKLCPTCGQEINAVEQGKHIEKNKDAINELINKGVENKKRIDELSETIVKFNNELNQLEENKNKLHRKNELELKMTAIKTNIENIKLQINELQRQKQEIETNKDNIKYNNEIDNKILVIDETIKVEEKIKDSLLCSIQDLKNQNQQFETEIDKRNNLIAKLEEEEVVIRNWSFYQELVGKNGIIKIVLKRALPLLNNEIKRLLNGLCDFNVEITVSDDNKVCMDLVRGDKRLDLGTCASGFETVMASIAIRHALSTIATLSRPNFTVYDEVMDGVAVSNYENIRKLFERVTKSYDFVIHITHNELIADWHDMIISVVKSEEGISKIKLD